MGWNESTMLLAIIAAAAFLSTFLGGLLALKLRDKLHLILGFSAGAVIGVAFFDLLPEAINFGEEFHSPSVILSFAALGFLSYLVLDRIWLIHGEPAPRGPLAAVVLCIHSLLDGAAIGLAFQASHEVGIVIAIAVLTHDFSDGINTVSMVVRHGGLRSRVLRWLFIDAIAPMLGILATLLFSVSEQQLGFLIAIFSGFFLYIGTSDLLPESHHGHPVLWTTFSTIIGMASLYAVVHLAG